MNDSLKILKDNLKGYKKKYFQNQLLKNSIIFVGIVLSTYLLATSLEFWLRFESQTRTILFFSLLGMFVYALIQWIGIPLYKLIQSDRQLSNEEAAKQIGQFFPDLKDKLLNTLQLEEQSKDSALITAAIQQRSSEISVFNFNQSIKTEENKRYGRFILPIVLIAILILIFIPQFFTESTQRIVQYNQEFEPDRLFSIQITNNSLQAYKNEDFQVNLTVTGEAVPAELLLISNKRKYKLTQGENGSYYHTFNKIQSSLNFQIMAADYLSPDYKINVVSRPDIRNLQAQLSYPSHTQLTDELLSNVGNLNIPEGTTVEWQLKTSATDEAHMYIDQESISMTSDGKNTFSHQQRFLTSQAYSISLINEHSRNKDSINYFIEIKKDEKPSIKLDVLPDTVFNSYIVLNGLIKDDYGLSQLALVYETSEGQESIPLPLNKTSNSQSFFYQFNLDSLKLPKDNQLEYYVQVWDNDGVNAPKSSTSAKYKFKAPNEAEISDQLDKEAQKTKSDLEKKAETSRKINDDLKKIEEELKSKNKVDWQDKKRIDDLVEDRKKLEEEMKELSQQHKQMTEQRQHFNQPDEKLQEKAAQLQKLMDDILDDETKQLYEELQKLLQEKSSTDKVEEVVQELQQKEKNMEQELERAIEMFKRMQFDFKMDEIINDLDQLAQEQQQNAEETKSNKADKEELQAKQEEINEMFEEISEKMEELDELNEQLENPEQLDDNSSEQEEVKESLKESSEQLKDNKKKKSSQSQEKAAQQMQQMSKKMQEAQSGMEMQQMAENLENLRAIVENLVKLSFDQEQILKDFKGVNQSDPRFVTLSQQQLKLKDDSKIIEDSLVTLSKRVFQIQSFVTRELSAMNEHIDQSLEMLRDRYQSKAVVSQQYSMTAINNLALLLDDVLSQMMQQMAEAMGQPQKGKKGKPQKGPSLSELQEKLNQQIQELQKSGKSGRELSKELAKLAAEQEGLREKLQQMGDKLKDGDQGTKSGLNEALKKMEETETDLVNKRITRETIQRQKEILTRMLKTEKAMREKELDKERKGEEAQQREKNLPPAFKEYLKQREKELELLQTVPTELNPYYKEEVNKYFKRLNEQ